MIGEAVRPLVERGVYLANEAVSQDREACKGSDAARYNAAIVAYVEAVKVFRQASRVSRDETFRARCRAKITEYLDRAELLKDWVTKHGKEGAPRGSAVKDAAGGSGAAADGGAAGADAEKKKVAQPAAAAADAAGAGKKMEKPTPAGGGDGDGDGDGEDDDEDDEAAAMRKALLGAVVTEKPNVKWDDIAGLSAAKEALKEAVVLPQKFPGMFTGARKPWKGILLYGPPGTGKSILAKAVATESSSYFISATSSDLISKWQGDSEKLVKSLFTLARTHAPSVIFLDEIDALASERSSSESESSRRVKTELLVQMDGVSAPDANAGVLVLAATNLPWALDGALLRRMERRVHIPLPDARARARVLALALGDTPHALPDGALDELAARAEGYSGADLATVVRDAVMEPVRAATRATHFRDADDGKFEACSPGADGAREVPGGLMALSARLFVLPRVTLEHFEDAFRVGRPSVGEEVLEKYEAFTKERGQEGA